MGQLNRGNHYMNVVAEKPPKKGSYQELRSRGLERVHFFIDGNIANLARVYAKKQGLDLSKYLKQMLIDQLVREVEQEEKE